MTRKKRKAKRKKTTPEKKKSPEALLKEGLENLNKERFRDAIDLFKTLIKEQENPEWLNYLAQAYQGRAKELVAKGMTQEARVMLDHMKSVCHAEADPILHISLSLNNGQYTEAVKHFLTLQQTSSNASFKRIESIFASLVLSGKKELITALPEDHPLITHRFAAADAVEALVRGKDDLCKELIQKISLRSPYRDYRLFLSGLISYYNDNEEEALSYFEKIPHTNSIKKLTEALSPLIKNPFGGKGINLNFEGVEASYIAALNGHNTGHIKAFSSMTTAFSKKNYPHLFSLLKNYSNLFDEALLKRFCSSLMIKETRLIEYYESLFGDISPFEYERIYALNFEQQRNLDEAHDYWDDSIDELTSEIFGSVEEQKIARALILRRMAAHEAKLISPMPFMDTDREYEIELLERSLEYDPYEKEVYNQLIDYYKEVEDKKNTKKWVDSFVNNFPNDAAALFHAAENAFDRNTFKKAVSFLDRILKLDPINREALEQKIFIHISKARNDIKKRKLHLARKEFQAAVACGERKSERQGSTLIKWGTMELLDKKFDRGEELLQKGYNLAGASIGSALIVCIESKRMGLAASLYKEYTTYLKEFLKESKPEYALELVDTILPYNQIEYKDKESDIKAVQNYLKKVFNHSFNDSDLLKICLYLFMNYDFTLLKKYSEKGKKEHPEILLFIYYFLIAKCQGEVQKLTYNDQVQVEDALERAEKAGDRESASKFEMLLKQIQMSSFFKGDKSKQLHKLIDEFLKRKRGEVPSMGDVFELLEGLEDEDEDDFDDFDDFDDSPRKQRRFPF